MLRSALYQPRKNRIRARSKVSSIVEQVSTVNSHVNLIRSLRRCTFVFSASFISFPPRWQRFSIPYCGREWNIWRSAPTRGQIVAVFCVSASDSAIATRLPDERELKRWKLGEGSSCPSWKLMAGSYFARILEKTQKTGVVTENMVSGEMNERNLLFRGMLLARKGVLIHAERSPYMHVEVRHKIGVPWETLTRRRGDWDFQCCQLADLGVPSWETLTRRRGDWDGKYSLNEFIGNIGNVWIYDPT